MDNSTWKRPTSRARETDASMAAVGSASGSGTTFTMALADMIDMTAKGPGQRMSIESEGENKRVIMITENGMTSET